MALITQEAFTALIEAVRLQTLKDRSNSITLGEVFNTDGINPYDNSILIKAIVAFLQLHFPKKNGHCEIEHYMFDMNFGKVGEEEEVITIENLWHQLNKQPIVSTHPLIDDDYSNEYYKNYDPIDKTHINFNQ